MCVWDTHWCTGCLFYVQHVTCNFAFSLPEEDEQMKLDGWFFLFLGSLPPSPASSENSNVKYWVTSKEFYFYGYDIPRRSIPQPSFVFWKRKRKKKGFKNKSYSFTLFSVTVNHISYNKLHSFLFFFPSGVLYIKTLKIIQTTFLSILFFPLPRLLYINKKKRRKSLD